MPKLRLQQIETAIGVLLLSIGALVLAGWWMHVVTLVQLLPRALAMVPNTALCFVLLGVALLDLDTRASRACAAASAAIATVVLSQYVFDCDLHVDRLLATIWVIDSNPHPGRMAPQTALCFIASATAILLPSTRGDARTNSLGQLLALLVGAIGIVSLIGYSFELDLLYSWYRYSRMALHTSTCFSLLGATLWLRWYVRGSQAGEFDAREDHRVSVIGSALIVLVAAVAGSSGFILLAAQTEKMSRAALTQTLDNQMALAQIQLQERRNDAAAIASELAHAGVHTAPLAQRMRSLLRDNITAIGLEHAEGTAATVGTFVRSPALALPLQAGTQLLWQEGATLHFEQLVQAGARPVRVTVEARLPVFARLIADSRALSVTGDLRICGALDAEHMRCLPTRLAPQPVVSTQRSRHGSPLAMSQALAGERGTVVFRNYRDHQAIGAFAPLAHSGLAFVLQQDTEDLYAPLRQRLQLLALVLGALIVVSVFILRSQVAPLVRKTLNASAEAAASAARTTAIMNSVPDGIITIDERGVIVAVNPALSNMFGYAAGELLGQPLCVLAPAELQSAQAARLRHFPSERMTQQVGRGPFEVPARRRDGSIFTAQLALTELCLGDKRFIVGNVRDVTVAKFAEAQTRRMTERLKLATQAARIGVWEWDVASDVMIWDARMHELYALPVGTTATHEQWRRRLHPADAERMDRTVDEAFRNASEFSGMFRIVLDDGSERALRSAAIVARDAHGKPQRVTGVNWDVTESMRLERMKSEFVSVVSHELRTPLTSIRGSLGLLAGSAAGTLPDKAQQLLQIAYRNTDRLALLVSDILDIEKIESGGMTFENEPLDLNELAAQAIEANQAYAMGRDVRLRLTTTRSEARVNGDAHRILQVMANLLSNAAKFSPAGAIVAIDVVLLPDRHVRVNVRDHGPGIPEAFKPRVFHKFSQADASDSRAKSGTGLGLAISKAIVERLGGRIGFDSPLGSGTVFYFDLPLLQAQPVVLDLRTAG